MFSGCGKPPAATAVSSPTTVPAASTGATPKASLISPSPTLSSIDAAALIARASQSISNLKYYYLDRRISAGKSTKADNSDLTTTVVNSLTTMDLEGRGMQMNNKIYVKLASGQTSGTLIDNTIYIMNSYMYIKGYFPDSPDVWSKVALSDADWSMQNQARLLVDLLEPQNVTLLAPEFIHIGGSEVPCSVLKITPDLTKLWAVLTSQPGYNLPTKAPEGFTFDQIVKSSEVSVWLDQSSGLPVQASVAVLIQVSPDQVSSFSSTVTFKLDINMQFSGFNREVKIDLPAEAAATDVPDLKDLQKVQN